MLTKIRKFLRVDANSERDIFIYSIMGLALFFGVFIRLNFIAGSEYPLNDGGLFYQKADDLIRNGLKLPKYTNYNSLRIPFAYPPTAFYLAGIINLVSDMPLLAVFTP